MSISITGLYTALTALLAIFLSLRIVFLRRRLQVGVGDGGHSELTLAIRAHANLLEYAPLALLLILLLEISGARSGLLHLLGGLLLLGRLMHAWGLSQHAGKSFGRFYGTALTWGVMLATSVLLLLKAVMV